MTFSTRMGFSAQAARRPLAKIPSFDVFRFIAFHLTPIITPGVIGASILFAARRSL